MEICLNYSSNLTGLSLNDLNINKTSWYQEINEKTLGGEDYLSSRLRYQEISFRKSKEIKGKAKN